MKKAVILPALIIITMLSFFLSCKKELSYEGGINQIPTANAGADQITVLPKDSVLLDGSNSKDHDGQITKTQWTKISGPLSYVIANTTTPITIVRSLTEGVYQFELMVTDDKQASARDTVQVTVSPSNGTNHPPVAVAGPDQSITLPVDLCTLDGSASYDPDGVIATSQWTKVAGPSSGAIAKATDLKTQATNLTTGTYQFELMVTDNYGASSKDTVQVTVSTVNMNSCFTGGDRRVNASLTEIGALWMARFPYVGAAGNKIVFAGGGYYTSPGYGWVASNVDIYDISSKSWTTAPFSQAREGMAVVSIGNKIFFAGGGTCLGMFGNGLLDLVYDNVDIYDAATNTWTFAQLSQPRTYMAAAAVGNKVFFAGGMGEDYEISNKVDIYDLTTSSWSVATLSEPRVDPRAVTVGDKIYIAGGYTDYNSPSSKVDIYNASTNRWSISGLQELSGGVSGVVKGNEIYWAGQVVSQNTKMGKVEIWNTANNSITTHCLSYSRYAPVGVVRNNEVAFFVDNGWWDDFAIISNQFEIYNTETRQWSLGKLPLSLASPAIININNDIYIGGGKTAIYTNTDKVYKLNW